MINLIHTIIKSIKNYRDKVFRKRFINKVTTNGKRYNIGTGANVLLMDGSQASDIELGEYVTIYGALHSQSGGKIIMGDYTRLGKDSVIRSVDYVKIGNYTAVADHVVISDNGNHPTDPIFRRKMKEDSLDGPMRLWKNSEHAPVIIGENVWVCEGVRINRGVKIGDNSIIAAGAIVTHDVPSNVIAAGIPAKVIKNIQ